MGIQFIFTQHQLVTWETIEIYNAKKMRIGLVKKYPELTKPPTIPKNWENIIGAIDTESHDYIDMQLLSSLDANAVNYLITDDQGIHSKAKRIGVDNGVVTANEALLIIQALFNETPPDFPPVEFLKAYSLNREDPIFDSFREDYPTFDNWLEKCSIEHRDVFVIYKTDLSYGGISIVKEEETGEYGLEGNILKVCSFKVAEGTRGFKIW